jgi:carboxypeptidase C (cathepsin A)
MVDFVTRVGWKTDARYNALSYEVGSQWERDGFSLRAGAVPDLRQAVAADPKLRVLIAHGWNDLSCPFMGSVLTVDQMPLMGDRRGSRCANTRAGTCSTAVPKARRSCARTSAKCSRSTERARSEARRKNQKSR